MIGKLATVAWDAPDHRALAQFYVDLFDGELTYAEDDWAMVMTPDGWRLGFQPAPDLVPTRWPDPAAPQQIHLDIQVPDKDAATKRAEQLGATQVGGGETWNVLTDPAGHTFCLCTNEQSEPIRVFAVNIDTDDPKTLAAFYGSVLGLATKYESDEAMWVGAEDGPMQNVLFSGVADYHAPQWRNPDRPQQLHLDIKVADIEEAEPSLLALGARRLDGGGDDFRVYADPTGHPFCLIW